MRRLYFVFVVVFLVLLPNIKGESALLQIEPRLEKTGLRVFLTRSDTGPTRSDCAVGGLKVRIYEEEGLYYLCSENKCADQLCGTHS